MPDYLSAVADVPFRLGRPEDLPHRPTGLASARTAAEALSHAAARTGTAALLDACRAVRTELAVTLGEPVGEDPDESEANRANDIAFGIVRTDGPPTAVLVDAALAALSGVLDLAADRGIGLDRRDWTDLVNGFDTVLAWLADPDTVPARPSVPAAPEIREVRPDDALRRWVRGHHVFMVFAQGGAMAARSLSQCAGAEDKDGAVVAASIATTLMGSSRAALRFAGDVTNLAYQSEIRPTLMPPVAPPKMSGLRWRDHEALVRQLAAARDGFAWLSRSHPELLQGFRAELETAYLAHRGVCESFVGTESPSLLATSRSGRSAVGVLDQFRELRLQLLPETGAQS